MQRHRRTRKQRVQPTHKSSTSCKSNPTPIYRPTAPQIQTYSPITTSTFQRKLTTSQNRRHSSVSTASRRVFTQERHHESPSRQLHTQMSALLEDEANKYAELSKFLPPMDHHEYSTKRNWAEHLSTHRFTVAADFVARLGHIVHIVDVRSEDELLGPGYIPGANWFPSTEIEKIVTSFPKDGLIAVVCSNDVGSRDVVRRLKQTGHNFAAILAGGMRTWKLMGFSASRDPSILQRRCEPVSVKHHHLHPLVPAPVLSSTKAGKRQMTLEQVSEHMGKGDTIQWLKMAAFCTHGRLSCVDGRDDFGIIGTPGGDMGEFLICLSVAEQLMNKPLSDEHISILFQRRLDAFGRFYMHTDQLALDRLISRLNLPQSVQRRVSEATPHFVFDILFQNVTTEQRELILDLLVEPEYIGCGHLRFLLEHADLYKVRKGLIRTALRCFFYSRFDGSTECDYVVLSGQHEECGVANVSFKNELKPFTKIPLVPPAIQGKQIFINHEQVSAYLRHQTSEWLLSQTDIVPMSKTNAAAFIPLSDLLANLHADLTVGNLAEGLPLYTLKFDEHGSCEVQYNGIIGRKNTAPAEPENVLESRVTKIASPNEKLSHPLARHLELQERYKRIRSEQQQRHQCGTDESGCNADSDESSTHSKADDAEGASTNQQPVELEHTPNDRLPSGSAKPAQPQAKSSWKSMSQDELLHQHFFSQLFDRSSGAVYDHIYPSTPANGDLQDLEQIAEPTMDVAATRPQPSQTTITRDNTTTYQTDMAIDKDTAQAQDSKDSDDGDDESQQGATSTTTAGFKRPIDPSFNVAAIFDSIGSVPPKH